MATIPLTQGRVALVDDDLAPRVAGFRWFYITKHGTSGYARRNLPREPGRRPTQYLHQLVWELLGRPPCAQIDHENRNGIDCRGDNLRDATASQNGANRPKQVNNASGYKGVYKHSKVDRWAASIRVNGRAEYLGLFDCPEDAARRYDARAREVFGNRALLNFGTAT